jgi:hypothetical protein
MQIRSLKSFSYQVGDGNVRVPRGLSVNLPDDAAKAAIAAGEAVAVGDQRPAPLTKVDVADDKKPVERKHAKV